jgi:hypothetical protein
LCVVLLHVGQGSDAECDKHNQLHICTFSVFSHMQYLVETKAEYLICSSSIASLSSEVIKSRITKPFSELKWNGTGLTENRKTRLDISQNLIFKFGRAKTGLNRLTSQFSRFSCGFHWFFVSQEKGKIIIHWKEEN